MCSLHFALIISRSCAIVQSETIHPSVAPFPALGADHKAIGIERPFTPEISGASMQITSEVGRNDVDELI
jgi:hypothetical protein